MAEPEIDGEDLFENLYDDDDETTAPVKAEPPTANAEQAQPVPAPPEPAQPMAKTEADHYQVKAEPEPTVKQEDAQMGDGGYNGGYPPPQDEERPIYHKDDGKMFIGGLNWETTDESLKNYFSQFGEVVECTVMRDGQTGRSRGFGFLTFKDPKNVNTVMVKEHTLDGKLIDPKRAIPRDEQERTAKIFVGGVSQDADQDTFKSFFKQFGNVLDATLMMDKETNRPRGFGFVTFDSEAAVDRTLEQPLAICNKPIEIKRAQPRGDMREQESNARGGKFGRKGQDNFGGGGGFGGQQQNQVAGEGQAAMSPAMLAAYWQRMQQFFMMKQQQMNNMGGMNPMAAMQANPQMMQQFMAQQGGMGNMNPQMMQQQMAAMQGGGFNNGSGSPMGAGRGFSAQEQMVFEQRKYEQQSQMGGMGRGNGGWDGGMGYEGGFGGARGGRGGARASGTPQPPPQAPAGAPTGPKNAGRPGANYRGGGRGGHRGGFHPYARGGG